MARANGVQTVLKWSRMVDEKGRFEFNMVPSGVYTLAVFHPNAIFEELRVEVNHKESGAIRARANDISSHVVSTFPHISMTPKVRIIPPKPPAPRGMLASLAPMLKSPMVIMLMIVGSISFIIPKILEGASEEEIKASKEKLSNFNSMLSR